MEEPIKQEETRNEEPLFPDALVPQNTETIYIDRKAPHRTKNRSDDVMMTQCIFCMILVLSIFGLHWISADFQEALLALYEEKVSAPAEPFLAHITEAAEQWFKR
ncbi:MAG: hypothetical protein IJ512_02725 [Ruminococcus sp.]|nr:hypothetical protein [Ruminococcus sp.]